jgi:hypothetical protein
MVAEQTMYHAAFSYGYWLARCGARLLADGGGC